MDLFDDLGSYTSDITQKERKVRECPGYLTADNYNPVGAKKLKKVIIPCLVLLIFLFAACGPSILLINFGAIAVPILFMNILSYALVMPSVACTRKGEIYNPELAVKMKLWRMSLTISLTLSVISTFLIMVLFYDDMVSSYTGDAGYTSMIVLFSIMAISDIVFIVLFGLGLLFTNKKAIDKYSKLWSFNDIPKSQRIVFNSNTYVPDKTFRMILRNRAAPTGKGGNSDLDKLSFPIRLLTTEITALIKTLNERDARRDGCPVEPQLTMLPTTESMDESV